MHIDDKYCCIYDTKYSNKFAWHQELLYTFSACVLIYSVRPKNRSDRVNEHAEHLLKPIK